MVTMNGNDRHLCSGGAPGKDIIAGEIPGGLLHVVARDGQQPGSDGRTVLRPPLRPPWLTSAMASGPPAFVNRMVRRWISRQAFGTERFSSAAE
jgi:hypothetical protein